MSTPQGSRDRLLAELARSVNRVAVASGVIVVVALFHILAPDTARRWAGVDIDSPTDSLAVAATAPPAEDDRVVDGIHVATGLVVDSGFVQVKATCLACHSSKLITQNRADRAGWEKMIRWMQETQNLWDLGANEGIILDYLAKHYAPQNTGRRAPLTDIEWYVLEP